MENYDVLRSYWHDIAASFQFIRKGRKAEFADEPKKALEIYKQAVTKYPLSRIANCLLADTHEWLGNWREAYHYGKIGLELVLKQSIPQSGFAISTLVSSLLERKAKLQENHHDAERAKALLMAGFIAAKAKNPPEMDKMQIVNGYITLGMVCLEEGDYQKAIELTTTGLKKCSHEGLMNAGIISSAHITLASSYFNIQKLPSAIAELHKTLETATFKEDLFIAHLLLAELYNRQGNSEAAERERSKLEEFLDE